MSLENVASEVKQEHAQITIKCQIKQLLKMTVSTTWAISIALFSTYCHSRIITRTYCCSVFYLLETLIVQLILIFPFVAQISPVVNFMDPTSSAH